METDVFDRVGQGTAFSELPAEYQEEVKRVYYERSIWASIELLWNGKYRIHNHVTMCYVACKGWHDAQSTREFMKQRYCTMERAFR